MLLKLAYVSGCIKQTGNVKASLLCQSRNRGIMIASSNLLATVTAKYHQRKPQDVNSAHTRRLTTSDQMVTVF